MIKQLRNIKSEGEILTRLEATGRFNENFWELVKILIFHKLQQHFKTTKGVSIELEDNIYNRKLFGNNLKQIANEFFEKYDIMFPNPDFRGRRYIIPILINLVWILFIIYGMNRYPEILIVGHKFMYVYALTIFFFPLMVIGLTFRKYLSEKRFNKVSNFRELVDILFVMNNFKYKVNNYKRFKIELMDYIKNTPPNNG